jgi:hypothetical protein
MNNNHRPHFPVSLLAYNGNLVLAAGQKYPKVSARLPANYLTETAALIAKVPADVTGQKIAKGESGNLTQAQQANLTLLLHYMNQARKTAKLAFPGGQTVKLHQEFQIGAHKEHDLPAVLGRADIILASVQTAVNLPALKAKGWTDADTAAFVAVRGLFPESAKTQQGGKSAAKKATSLKDTDAADLYEHILTIQNAGDLEFPAIDPANAAERDEFRLGLFPPDNHAPPAPPTPPATTPPTK